MLRNLAVAILTGMYSFTLDTVTEFLLGQSVHSMEEEQSSFAGAFAAIQYIQLQLLMLSARYDPDYLVVILVL